MTTPADLKITPRDMDFDILTALKKNLYWNGNEPVKTHYENALQSVFPVGERMMIESVRDIRDRYENKLQNKLLEEVKMFIRQEAQHSTHHAKWNDALIEIGYKELHDELEKSKKLRVLYKKYIPARLRLAVSCAIEHYTTVLIRITWHEYPEIGATFTSDFRDLLLYHGIEEMEHKGVCFDLYQATGGGYILRALGMVLVTLILAHLVRKRHKYFLQRDSLWNKKTKRKAFGHVWGSHGLVIKLIPHVLNYLRPGFHPWEFDDRVWVRNEYADELKRANISPFA